MASTRRNTLVIDFSVLPVKPNAGDIEEFLRNSLEIEMASIKNLQLHTIRNCALIEMRSLEAAERVASLHHLKHSMTAGEKKYNIPVHIEDTATNVRIHDLPPSMPNEVVAEHMSAYGKVKSVARELWKKFFPGIPNGVRVVRIELEKQVPSFIRICNEHTAVSYRSQIPTCRQCERKAHPKLKCSEAAAKEKEKEETGMESSCIAPPARQKQQPADKACSVADNHKQMMCGDPEEERNKKRQQQTNSESLSSLDYPPPKKKPTIEATRSTDASSQVENRDFEMGNSDDDDSGPDPAPDDIDGWILKFNKRSKRQKMIIASLKKY